MHFRRSKSTLDSLKGFSRKKKIMDLGGNRPRWVPLDLPQAILLWSTMSNKTTQTKLNRPGRGRDSVPICLQYWFASIQLSCDVVHLNGEMSRLLTCLQLSILLWVRMIRVSIINVSATIILLMMVISLIRSNPFNMDTEGNIESARKIDRCR